MTRHVHMVAFGGETMPLYQAAKLAGLSGYCVRKRYAKGERGDELLRPVSRGRSRTHPNLTSEQQEALRAKREAKDAAERAKQDLKLARQRREQQARERVAAEHAAAFARPLIDARLLKPMEHLAIVERVKYCGQRNWSLKGLA
jgi:hypothetical protein